MYGHAVIDDRYKGSDVEAQEVALPSRLDPRSGETQMQASMPSLTVCRTMRTLTAGGTTWQSGKYGLVTFV